MNDRCPQCGSSDWVNGRCNKCRWPNAVWFLLCGVGYLALKIWP